MLYMCACVMLARCTADLPARALLCNMKSFNGRCACPTCSEPGDNTLERTSLHRFWPHMDTIHIRTASEVKRAFVDATNSNEAVSATYLRDILYLLHVIFSSGAGIQRSSYTGSSPDV